MKKIITITLIVLFINSIAYCENLIGINGNRYNGPMFIGGGLVDDPVYEVKRILFTMDSEMTHSLAAYNDFAAIADTILELGTDVPEFVYCDIDSLNAMSSVYVANATVNHINGTMVTTKNSSMFTNEYVDTRVNLFYIDFAEYIPTGATILSAEITYSNNGSWYLTSADSVVTVLMTNENDNKWHTSAGVVEGVDSAAMYSHASWRHQILGLGVNSNGYPETSSSPWLPELKDRKFYWDWGDYFDWTGFEEDREARRFIPTLEGAAINIKNSVQAVSNGAVNNGIMVYMKDANAAVATNYYVLWEVRDTATNNKYTPFVTVTYTTMPYQTKYPDGDFAFLFTTDDGVADFNTMCRDTVEKYDAGYTMFVCKSFLEIAGRFTGPQCIAHYHKGSVGFGGHSVWHEGQVGDATPGLTHWDARATSLSQYTRGCDPDDWDGSETGRDSLYADADPAWMYDLAVAEGVPDGHWSRHDFGKTIALPEHRRDPNVNQVLAYHNYKGVRIGFAGWAYSDVNYRRINFTDASYRTARADTAFIGTRVNRPLFESNTTMVPLSTDIQALYGTKVETPTWAQVRRNLRGTINDAIASGSGVVSIYAHDDKDGSYPTGIADYEFGWTCELVQEMVGWMPKLSEYVDWITYFSTPVATPLGYALDDSFVVTADDSVWWKPTPETRLFSF